MELIKVTAMEIRRGRVLSTVQVVQVRRGKVEEKYNVVDKGDGSSMLAWRSRGAGLGTTLAAFQPSNGTYHTLMLRCSGGDLHFCCLDWT